MSRHIHALEPRRLFVATLDAGFGNGGIVEPPFGTLSGLQQVYFIAPTTDGKVIVGGQVSSGGATVARYLPSGELDTTFGGGDGVADSDPDAPTAVGGALQEDGKIVMAGGNRVIRFNPDGSVDTSFGDNGVAEIPASVFAPDAVGGDSLSVALQDDGKIVIGGSVRLTLPDDDQREVPFLARLNSDGDVDATFGGDGGILVDPPGVAQVPSSLALVHQVALAADTDKVVAVGQMRVAPDGATRGFVARFNADGTPDTGFDGDGFKLIESFGSSSTHSAEARTLITLPSDELLVGGFVQDFGGPVNESDDAVIFRYNADGSLDAAFGQHGVVRSEGIIAHMVTTDGGGILALTQREGENFTGLQAYDTDGNPDTSYGPGGAAILHERSTTFIHLALDAQGRALYTGGSFFARAGVRPTAAIGANGTLVVTGDDTGGASDVDVLASGDDVLVTVDGEEFTFAADDVTGLDVWAGGGADHVVVNADIDRKTIVTGAGNDTVETGRGHDRVTAGDGDDLIATGGGGGDRVTAGDGDDLVVTAAGNDSVTPGDGNDTVFAGGGEDRIVALGFFQTGDDDARNVFHGGDGDDVIISAGGHDSLYGGAGRDRIAGGAGADLLSGGGGRDLLFGAGGNDRLFGGDNNDRLSGGKGSDRLYGGAGDDEFSGGRKGNDVAIDTEDDLNDEILAGIEQKVVVS